MSDDPLPGMIASMDQFLAFLPMLAKMYRKHYEAMLAEGFTPEQSLALTIAMLDKTMELGNQ